MEVNSVVMAGYFVLTLGMGMFYGNAKTESSVDFTVSGRALNGPLLFSTLVATIIGASMVMGAVSWFSIRGLSQIWFYVGLTIAFFVYMFYLGPRINTFGREHGGETVGDWFVWRYGRAAKYPASVLMGLAHIAITANQYLAMAILMEAATGISFAWGLALTALIVMVYTTAGGLWAVASTDIIQGAMTFLAIVIMVPLFFSRAGGFSAVITALPETQLRVFGNVTPWNAFGSVLTFALSIITWPSIWQRMYAAKDIPSIKQSYGIFIIVFIVIVAADMGIGFTARTLMPAYEGSANAMLPKMIMTYLPNVTGAVLLAALMAVLMGSADSILLVSAILIEKDLVAPFLKKNRTDRQKLVSTKIITALTGVAVLVVLYFKRDMFELWVLTSDITAATLAVPILLGFAWKRPNEKAALGSIIFGFGGWLFFTLRPDILPVSPILPGAAFSLGAYLAAAFMFPAQKKA